MEDNNPAYESANAEASLDGQVTDRNPQYVADENPQCNSGDQIDDYDYMGQ